MRFFLFICSQQRRKCVKYPMLLILIFRILIHFRLDSFKNDNKNNKVVDHTSYISC